MKSTMNVCVMGTRGREVCSAHTVDAFQWTRHVLLVVDACDNADDFWDLWKLSTWMANGIEKLLLKNANKD